MTGNVWEWCTDFYDDNYYNNSTTTNSVNTKSSNYRVGRGGGWGYNADYLSVGGRDYSSPTGSNLDLGFRVVRTY